jgi:hypothetical protein
MAEGYSNQGIADRMGVAGRTVEAYVSDILASSAGRENGDGTTPGQAVLSGCGRTTTDHRAGTVVRSRAGTEDTPGGETGSCS